MIGPVHALSEPLSASSRGQAIRTAALARRYLETRRRRCDLVAPGLFADPGWDILLDLYASDIEGVMISVSSACIASGVPTSTALSWIRKLEERGLLVRQRDEQDGRRTFLRISEAAAASVTRWLDATFNS